MHVQASTTHASWKPDEIRPLTSLRFFAASLVVLHHLAGVLWLDAGLFHPFNLGNAVSFFFVLSGFVLYYSYAGRVEAIGWWRFSVLRFFRIWPAHIAVLLLGWVILVTPGYTQQLAARTPTEIAQIVFLLQSWTPRMEIFWGFNAPSWSISTELFFYVAFPLLVPLVHNRPFVLFGGLAAMVAVYLLIATNLVFDPEQRFMNFGLGAAFPFVRLPEFVLGMAIAALMAQVPTRPDRQERAQNKALWTVIELLVLAAAIAANAQLLLLSTFVNSFAGDVAMAWARAAGAAPVYGLVIAIFFLQRGHISDLLSNRVLVWLGTISFAEYLVHQPLIFFWRRVAEPALENTPISVVMFVIVLVALSAAIHACVEKPGIALSRRLVRPRAGHAM